MVLDSGQNLTLFELFMFLK